MAGFLPGDVLARRKGMVMHHGIALGGGRVLHNTPDRGEHISSLADFAQGQKIRVQKRNLHERNRALVSASSLSAGGSARHYHLLDNNCEHTVHRYSGERPQSPQLRGWLAGVGCAAVALALTRHPGAAVAGFALGKKLLGR